MNTQKLLVLTVLAVIVTGCGTYFEYMDQPKPAPWEYFWTKDGLNIEQVKQAYISCGFDDPTWSVQMQMNVEQCMLKNGFVYRDHPYFEECHDSNPTFKKTLPSCQSLKK